MYLALAALTSLLALVTFASRCRSTAWWIRVLDFPRLQFAIALALLLVAQLWLLDPSKPAVWVMLASTSVCLAYQLWWILPYTTLVKTKVRTCRQPSIERRLAVMTANVLTPNRNSDKLIELVRQHKPDILVALETDQWWLAQLEVLQEQFPHTLKCPLDNLYGMSVFSQLPLHDGQIEFLVEDDKPSMHASVELRCGRCVRVHFLHPAPPSPTENAESLERDAELLVVGKSVAKDEGPVLVTGDLNDVAWSATSLLFKKISGLFDPRVGRGLFNTFNAKHWFLRWPLDHVFLSGHFTVAELRRLPPFGSDHFPLYIELYLEDQRDDDDLSADGEERAEANEKIEDADTSEREVPNPK